MGLPGHRCMQPVRLAVATVTRPLCKQLRFDLQVRNQLIFFNNTEASKTHEYCNRPKAMISQRHYLGKHQLEFSVALRPQRPYGL